MINRLDNKENSRTSLGNFERVDKVAGEAKDVANFRFKYSVQCLELQNPHAHMLFVDPAPSGSIWNPHPCELSYLFIKIIDRDLLNIQGR